MRGKLVLLKKRNLIKVWGNLRIVISINISMIRWREVGIPGIVAIRICIARPRIMLGIIRREAGILGRIDRLAKWI